MSRRARFSRRPLIDRSAVLVRRGYVCDYEVGERSLPKPDRVLRLGRPGLLAISTVACVRTDRPVVSLTYDDGPDPQFTPRILDLLAETDSRVTFFVLVEAAERQPRLIARMLAEGHEVALHGIDHARLSHVPARRSLALIRVGRDRLEQLTQQPVSLFRPTYGAQTLRQYLGARALGLEVVVWSAWARDWDGAPAEVVADRTLTALHRGGFVLLHDASGDGVGAARPGRGEGLDRARAAELTLAGMAQAGYVSRTASELLATFPAVRTVWVESRRASRSPKISS